MKLLGETIYAANVNLLSKCLLKLMQTKKALNRTIPNKMHLSQYYRAKREESTLGIIDQSCKKVKNKTTVNI